MNSLANCSAASRLGRSHFVLAFEKAGGINFLLSTLLLLTAANDDLIKGQQIKSEINEGF